MRFAALMITGLIAGLCPPAAVYAGNTETEPDDADDRILEEIIVVGSRVSRTNLDSPSPVIIFEASELKAAGITTLGEFSRYLPQNAAIAPPGALTNGTAGFNLRGIGLDATLTLVNGRRIAPYGPSGSDEPFVDINSIPIAAIDRIEILTDGASAIYGSEAVAGVVNIVTLQKIDGVTAEGGFLTTGEGDGDEWDLSVAGGWNNDDTSVTGTISWFDQDVIWNRDRDWSSTVDLRDQGGYDEGNIASSPPTMFLVDSEVLLADPACPEDSLVAYRVVYTPGEEEVCSFNYWNFTTLQHPTKRLGMTSSLRHDFSDTTTFFAEVFANRSETDSVAAPTVLNEFFVPAYHPNNPYGEDLFLYGRMLDIGNRTFNNVSKTWRLVAGVEGSWGTWDWEAALTASEAEADQTRYNDALTVPVQDALLGLGGPDGDQFYNPFGLNPENPPEVIEQFAISGTHSVQTSRQQTADFQVSGKFGNLPGGQVGSAFGGQFRHQAIDQTADPEELTGVIVGTEGFEPISESSDIYSVFAEFVVPVLPTLETQLALRLDDYSDSGSTTNPKIGLGWKPVEGLLLRTTWGTSFRPPTFRELTDPVATFADVIFNDPWRCPVTGASIDCEFNAIIGESSGNPDLKPDEGETWLLGIAWQPTGAPGFSIALDYWSIKHTNRITDSGGRFLFANVPPEDNPYIIRAPQTAEDVAQGVPGVIIGRRFTYINADQVVTDGIDFNVNYTWKTTSAGVFSSGITYTYLNEFKTGFSFQQAQFEEDIAGRFGLGPWPQHRGNLNLGWERGPNGASMVLNYAGRYQSPVNLVVDGEETETPFIIDDFWNLDLQYSYVFNDLKDATLRLGCRNCLNADPPVYNYPVPGEFFHEGRGVLLYLRWTQPFK